MGIVDKVKSVVSNPTSAVSAIAPQMVIGTGSQLVGDYLAYRSAKKEGERNRQAQREANIQNYNMQKEFAQMGIQWKVEDGRKAGLSALASIGAQGYNAQPSYVAGTYGNEKGNMYRSMGQNINRVMTQLSMMDSKSDIELKQAQTDYWRAKANNEKSGMTGLGNTTQGMSLQRKMLFDKFQHLPGYGVDWEFGIDRNGQLFIRPGVDNPVMTVGAAVYESQGVWRNVVERAIEDAVNPFSNTQYDPLSGRVMGKPRINPLWSQIKNVVNYYRAKNKGKRR